MSALAAPRHARPEFPIAEQLAVALYGSLSEAQRQEVCFDLDHVDPRFGLVRSFIANHWQVTRPVIHSDFFTAGQREIIHHIFRSLLDPDWYPRFIQQIEDDTKSPWGRHQSIAILGNPTVGPFQFVLCGRHLTLRADGGTGGSQAFGGPIVYGHAATGFYEKAGHPGNVFWPQAIAMRQLHDALRSEQRAAAVVEALPKEHEINFRSDWQGLPVSLLDSGQRKLFDSLLASIVAPFRSVDRKRVHLCIERQGGAAGLSIAIARPRTEKSAVEEEWRLEGPAFVWHFRGVPHVHVWVNVADHPGAPVTARPGAFLHPDHDPLG